MKNSITYELMARYMAESKNGALVLLVKDSGTWLKSCHIKEVFVEELAQGMAYKVYVKYEHFSLRKSLREKKVDSFGLFENEQFIIDFKARFVRWKRTHDISPLCAGLFHDTEAIA